MKRAFPRAQPLLLRSSQGHTSLASSFWSEGSRTSTLLSSSFSSIDTTASSRRNLSLLNFGKAAATPEKTSQREETPPVPDKELYQPVLAEEYVMEKKPIPIHAKYVWCEGGSLLGHPRIYVPLNKPGIHACGYCGQRYEKIEDHHHH